MADVRGRPLLAWVIERLGGIGGTLVIATTPLEEDTPIARLAREMDVPCHRPVVAKNNIVGRMEHVIEQYPKAKLIMRCLGDCPFISRELVKHAARVLQKNRKDGMVWHTSPDTWPVYGAREFPISLSAWRKLAGNAGGEEREHPDLFFHRNRGIFKILYHQPPGNIFFRNYRLEVDYPQDLELVRRIAVDVGMLAPLSQIIGYLDRNQIVANINRDCVEKTGPLSSFAFQQRRRWAKWMRGQPVLGWDGSWWEPPHPKAQPIFCLAGRHFLGYGWEGKLHTPQGIINAGWITCDCGTGRNWMPTQARGRR